MTLTFRSLMPATGVTLTAQLTDGQDEYADLVPAVGANTSLTVDTANVVLTFSADPPPNSQVGLGATVVYTIAVQNTGTVTVPGISVTSTAPAGMVFVSSEPEISFGSSVSVGQRGCSLQADSSPIFQSIVRAPLFSFAMNRLPR